MIIGILGNLIELKEDHIVLQTSESYKYTVVNSTIVTIKIDKQIYKELKENFKINDYVSARVIVNNKVNPVEFIYYKLTLLSRENEQKKEKRNMKKVMIENIKNKLKTFSTSKFVLIGLVENITERQLIISIEEVKGKEFTYFNLPIEYTQDFYKKFLFDKIELLDMVGLRGKITVCKNRLHFMLEECELIEKNSLEM